MAINCQFITEYKVITGYSFKCTYLCYLFCRTFMYTHDLSCTCKYWNWPESLVSHEKIRPLITKNMTFSAVCPTILPALFHVLSTKPDVSNYPIHILNSKALKR